MISYFPKKIIDDWKADVMAQYDPDFPEEVCGLFVESDGQVKYRPMFNMAIDREKVFEFDAKEYATVERNFEIKAVLHSHINFPHASRKDMEMQQSMGIPWGILNVHKGAPREVFFFGEQLPVQDFIGRPFIHGVYDCYGTIRDFYRVCGVPMIDHPRQLKWWEYKDTPNLLLSCYEENEFHRVSHLELQPGDCIFMQIGGRQVNHVALYLGENLILHHLMSRLSRREPYTIWARKANFIVRYDHASKNSLIWDLSTKIRRGTYA